MLVVPLNFDSFEVMQILFKLDTEEERGGQYQWDVLIRSGKLQDIEVKKAWKGDLVSF